MRGNCEPAGWCNCYRIIRHRSRDCTDSICPAGISRPRCAPSSIFYSSTGRIRDCPLTRLISDQQLNTFCAANSEPGTGAGLVLVPSHALSAFVRATRDCNCRILGGVWPVNRAIASCRTRRSGRYPPRRVAPKPAIETRRARKKCSQECVVRDRPRRSDKAACPTPGSPHDSVIPIRRWPRPPTISRPVFAAR